MSHDELDAIAARYARRDVGDLYSPLRPEVWQAQRERQRALAILLARHATKPLNELQVLDVGCGQGDQLLDFLRLGFDPERLMGSELLPERAAAARHRLPAATRLYEGDALALPLPDASVDIVCQATVFSSILDAGFQQRLATRMWQWLKPGGAVLWYDFTFDNPRNPDVRGVPLKRVRQLFPAGRMTRERLTLAPPLARPLVALHPSLYTLFNLLPMLRTHLLCWIEKPT